MEQEHKKSRCAFVAIKLKISGEACFFMRRDRDWKDVNFIGGHQQAKDRATLENTARRELLEEIPVIRDARFFSLAPLTGEIKYGPVFSKSANRDVKYDIKFFLMRFERIPTTLVRALAGRTLNVLIWQADLLVARTYRVSRLVEVLNGSVPGGIGSIAYSWPEDLEQEFRSNATWWREQGELPLEWPLKSLI